MDKYAVITIDTESDHDASWRKGKPVKFDSVLTGAPEKLQPLFNKYQAVPTYLLSIEVIESLDCVKCLKSLPGKYELGTHLHPEYADPDKRYLNYEGTVPKDFACYLEPEKEFLKIKTITDEFVKSFGYRPVSYRAGRFGAGGNTIRSLERLGYKVDTSVTPYCFWPGKNSVDFTDSPDSPYFPSYEDIKREGNSKILEVPVTIRPRKYLSEKFTSSVERSRWLKNVPLLSKVIYKCLSPVWLEPAFSNEKEMIDLVKRVIKNDGEIPPVVNIMFHSMEIIRGASPMSETEENTRRFLNRLDKLISYLSSNKFKFIGLSELYGKI